MADSLDGWVQACSEKMLQIVKDKAKRATDVLIDNTPVRHNARMRNSFRASINEPVKDTDPGHGKHPLDGSESRDQIYAVIDQLEVGDKLYIGSDAPGIVELEEGGHNVTPARMMFAARQQWSD